MDETYSQARKIISEAITVFEIAEDTAEGYQQLVLLDIIEIFREERKKIDVANLSQSNSVYAALTEGIKSAKVELDKLTAEIKEIIKVAEQAAQVLGALVKVIAFAAKVAI
ncbi:MAG: hypothetical protein V7776_03285 [Halopseudomonas aestusnigri]